MKLHAHAALLTTALVLLASVGHALAGEQEGEMLEGPEWRFLRLVTGWS